MPNVAIQSERFEQWFGEGEAKTIALRDVNLEAEFGEMVYIVALGKREDDSVERSLRNSEAEFRQCLGGRNRYLES